MTRVMDRVEGLVGIDLVRQVSLFSVHILYFPKGSHF